MKQLNQKISEYNNISISRSILSTHPPFIISEISDYCLLLIFYRPSENSALTINIDSIINELNQYESEFIIIDLSKFSSRDNFHLDQLNELNKVLYIMGMKAIYCGIQHQVANNMTTTEISNMEMDIEKNTKKALLSAYQKQGLVLRMQNPKK